MMPFTTQNIVSRRWSQSGVFILKSDSFWSCKVSPGVDRKFSGAKVDGEREIEKFIWADAFKGIFQPFFANDLFLFQWASALVVRTLQWLYNDSNIVSSKCCKYTSVYLYIQYHSTRMLCIERRYPCRREVHRVAVMSGCRSVFTMNCPVGSDWSEHNSNTNFLYLAFLTCISKYWLAVANSIRQHNFDNFKLKYHSLCTSSSLKLKNSTYNSCNNFNLPTKRNDVCLRLIFLKKVFT